MASWYKKRGTDVVVYYYDKLQAKQVNLPRPQTKHLDDLPSEDIEAWVRKWAEDNGHKVHRALKHSLLETDELRILWGEFQTYYQAMRNIEERTIEKRDASFQMYVVPYFVGRHGEKDVRTWYKYVGGYSLYILSESGLKNMVDKKKLIWMVRRFGEYLVSVARVLAQPWVLMMPSSKAKATTPLKVKITPDVVLTEARKLLARGEAPRPKTMKSSTGKIIGLRKTKFPNERIMALSMLIGYFGSLGPGEVYGLHKEDLITGTFAKKAADKTYPGLQRCGLGSGLSLTIERQLGSTNMEKYPKNDYRRGVVNVWNVEAAKLIAEIVREEGAGRLFHLSRARLDKLHAKYIKTVLGVTGHDLRRSSALYLGRTIKTPLELLQAHLRHAEIETTMLYIREPEVEEQKVVEQQDFDDVG